MTSSRQEAGFDGPAIRIIEGKRLVQDGPFADTKEQLGGYFLIDVPDCGRKMRVAACLFDLCRPVFRPPETLRPLRSQPVAMQIQVHQREGRA
jgi:hypothetical protein